MGIAPSVERLTRRMQPVTLGRVKTDFRPEKLKILPLRNSVIFPASVVPVNVGRTRSVKLVEDLLSEERPLLAVVSQRSPDVDDPMWDDLYEMGTIARVVKVSRLGPASYSVVVHGLSRMKIAQPDSLEPFMTAEIVRIPDDPERDEETDRLGQQLREAMRELLDLVPSLPRETASVLENVRETSALADLIAANLDVEDVGVADKQRVLETVDVGERTRRVLALVERQLGRFKVRSKVTALVADEGQKQREEILRQQMRNIREELGESAEDDEVEILRERVRVAQLSDDAQKIAKKQLGRLSGMSQQSAEFNVTRTYLEWLSDSAVAKDHAGQARRRGLPPLPRGRPLRPRQGEKADHRVRGGAPAPRRQKGADPVLRRPSRRREDLARPQHRSLDGAPLPPHRARRRARRGRDPRPPPYVRGRAAGSHHPRPEKGRREEPGARPRRDRQARRRRARRSVGGAARGARSSPERHVPGPLHRHALRPLAGRIPGHGQQPRHHSRSSVRPPRGHRGAPATRVARRARSPAIHLCPKEVSSHGLTPDIVDFTERGHLRHRGRPHPRSRRAQPGARDRCGVQARGHAATPRATPRSSSSTPPRSRSILGAARFTYPTIAELRSQPGVVTGLAWTPSGGDISLHRSQQDAGQGRDPRSPAT